MTRVKQKGNEDDLSAALTLGYRREAALLLSSSSGICQDSSVVRQLQQSLGQQVLQNDACVEDSQDDDSSGETLDLRVPASELCCITCGSWLQPGQNGTTLRLRSLRRGNTRRRRASRRRAAECLAKRQSTVAGGRFWRNDEESKNQTRQDDKAVKSLHCVTDGRARNAVVVTCGVCKTKIKYKGLPPRRQTHSVASKKQQQNLAKQINSSAPADFVPLGQKKESESHKPKTRIEMGGKKKRKSKKEPTSKSGLLDFLSTLND